MGCKGMDLFFNCEQNRELRGMKLRKTIAGKKGLLEYGETECKKSDENKITLNALASKKVVREFISFLKVHFISNPPFWLHP